MEYIRSISLAELPPESHRTVKVGRRKLALFHYQGAITALGNGCLHEGGPLGEGFIQVLADGETYVACPWHGWQYHLRTGEAPEGFADRQAVYDVRVEDGHILVSAEPIRPAHKAVHAHDPFADLRELRYETGPGTLNVLGISTTVMNDRLPRASTSEQALQTALDMAAAEHGASTRMIKLRDLDFRHCEGYYSRH